MIGRDDACHTAEFDDYFVIMPQATWWDTNSYLSRTGSQLVHADFEYNSANNPDVMTSCV